MNYIDGYLLAVPNDKRDTYRQLAEKSWALFKEWGATRHVETWSDDVPHGHTTDFYRAVQARDAESVVCDLFARYADEPQEIPAEWAQNVRADDGETRLRRIADFIAGMTDRYALIEHARLFPATPELR